MLNATPSTEVKLLVLDPGHFHAALVQKTLIQGVSSRVHVYAPEGSELQDYLTRIQSFNSREQTPTRWETIVHTSADCLGTMLRERPGNLVVLAGKNCRKTEYLKACVEAGLNVLSDKPMCIDDAGFSSLQAAFASARQKNIFLCDLMTERFEMTSILQRRIIQAPEVFGELECGTPQRPGVVKESVHYLRKQVAGKTLLRPPWYFDVRQQGEGIVDVSTHLVDLVMWTCFPEQAMDFQKDIRMVKAGRWFTPISRAQFKAITGLDRFPEYLKHDIKNDDWLRCYCNGEMYYRLRGVHVRIRVVWNYEDPTGGVDTHFSIVRGTRAQVIIRQGSEENFCPELFIEPVKGVNREAWTKELKNLANSIDSDNPGVTLREEGLRWRLLIPDDYRVGHEAHFVQVTESFIESVRTGRFPAWEAPNMLAKYYTTTSALKLAMEGA